MNVRSYLQITGTGAFVAFILYLYEEMAAGSAGLLKYIFFGLFIVFSILSMIDALKGGLNDKEIIEGAAKKAKEKAA